MRLTDCNLDTSQLWISPPVVTRPTPEWVDAHEREVIPKGLFRLYTSAQFLSVHAPRGFLGDSRHVLFGYFGTLLRGLRAIHIESKDERESLEQSFADKSFKGKAMGKSADAAARRHLKHFLIAQTGLLDALAELIALFFSSEIKGLSVGRADFSTIETWLRTNTPAAGSIVSTSEHFLLELHRLLTPLIVVTGPDRDWFQLLQLLRNKLAHISHPILFTGIHDSQGTFYTFIPKRWPFIKEELFIDGSNDTTLGERYKEVLMQQDLLSFCRGLDERTRKVVDTTCNLLSDAYGQFEQLSVNQVGLDQLSRNTKEYEFEGFF